MTNRPKIVYNKQLPNTLAVITESDKELDDKDEISLVSQKASDVTPIPVMSQATHDAENHSPNVTKHYRCIRPSFKFPEFRRLCHEKFENITKLMSLNK